MANHNDYQPKQPFAGKANDRWSLRPRPGSGCQSDPGLAARGAGAVTPCDRAKLEQTRMTIMILKTEASLAHSAPWHMQTFLAKIHFVAPLLFLGGNLVPAAGGSQPE